MLYSGMYLVRAGLPSADAAKSEAKLLHLKNVRIEGYSSSGAIVEIVRVEAVL